MSMIDDAPEVDVCDGCDLIAYPLHECQVGTGDPNAMRLCRSCVEEHAFASPPCYSCNETIQGWTREDFCR